MSSDFGPKTIKDLMQHLRQNKGIEVKDEHTRQLINYGYYHAYKGYRFFKKPESLIPYTTFEQIIAVIDYDNGLKASFYPEIMFLETALKNIVVENVIEGLSNAGVEEVFKQKMSDDKDNEVLSRQRAHLKEKIHSSIAKRNSQKNSIISHFCERGDCVPMWAVFEVLSLSDFATFTYCLNEYTRVGLLRMLKMQLNEDDEKQLLASVLYTIKDLRNAIAHNNVIFDTRFKDKEINPIVCTWLEQQTRIEGIDFNSIIDYFILVCVLLQKIEYNDEKIKSFMDEVEGCINKLYKDTPSNIYIKLTTTKLMTKLNGLKEYIVNE